MAGMTITTSIGDLRTLFNDVKEVWYKSSEIKSTDLAANGLAVEMELPVLEEGVTFNTGDADVTRIKLTTGETWTSKAKEGDPDISFQVASIAGDVNDLFMKKVTSAIVAAASGIIDGKKYKGSGYDISPKKVTGALVMPSEDRQTIIILPNVEIYASFVAADGDKPAYFNVDVTPLKNSENADIFVLESDETGA